MSFIPEPYRPYHHNLDQDELQKALIKLKKRIRKTPIKVGKDKPRCGKCNAELGEDGCITESCKGVVILGKRKYNSEDTDDETEIKETPLNSETDTDSE